MAKRQTPIQKLVAFAMSVTEDELNGAMDTLKAIKDSRFPKGTTKPRKARSDTGKSRTPTPTSIATAAIAGEQS